MNAGTKQQVFDVLGSRLAVEIRGLQASTIPDDIESLMLDWLVKWISDNSNNAPYYRIVIIFLSENIAIRWGNKAKDEINFSFRNTPRPVAIAKACVWVYSQLNAKEESK